MAEVTRKIPFETGIEQIVDYSDMAPANLPVMGQVVPGESFFNDQLTDVLFPPTIEQALVESLRPQVQNRELLTPNGFHGTLEKCREDLRNALPGFEGRPEGDKIQNLVDLLDEGESLYQLFNTFRYLLQQA